MQYPELDTFLSARADTLRPLLGPHWPIKPWKVEQFGPLTKYTLGQMPNGDWAMLHYISGPDHSAPHCHPCRMQVHTIQGSYWEREYFGDGRTQDHTREAGSSHIIEPDCIHSILSVSAGGYWSLVFAGPVVRAWQHYPELVGTR